MSVRLLTGRSPALPLGVWLAAGGTGGALLSGMATALALHQGRFGRRRRDSTAAREDREPWFATRRTEPRARPAAEADGPQQASAEPVRWPQAEPERAAGEPPPTVSVPFRVLRRPQRSAAAESGLPTGASASTTPPHAEGTLGRTAADADDWDSGVEEEW